MFKIVVTEILNPPDQPQEVKRYEQTVDALDMKAVMKAVNTRPRAPRKSRSKITTKE